MNNGADSIQQFIDRVRYLVGVEKDAEIQESNLLLTETSPKVLELAGLSIGNLTPLNISVFFGGKDSIELGRHPGFSTDSTFPAHDFRPGDLACITTQTPASSKPSSKSSSKANATKDIEAVVYKVTQTKIVLTINSGNDDKSELDIPDRCRIVKVANINTFKRLEKTMDALEKRNNESKLTRLDRILLGQESLPTQKTKTDKTTNDDNYHNDITFLDQNLNSSQKRAVEFILDPDNIVGLIHGPPGTGKTSTVVEIIRQFVKQEKSILVCGASNLAVDNILERLQRNQDVPNLTRLGHPARVQSQLHTCTLDYQMSNSDEGLLVKDIKTEIEQHFQDLRKGKVKGKERKERWEEIKELRKDLRKREGGVVKSVVNRAKVVLCTCHGAGGRQIQDCEFDIVIIDEAAQALEAQCWIPILKGKKLVLAGDHLQLPPTIKSADQGRRRRSTAAAASSKSSKAKSNKSKQKQKSLSKTEAKEETNGENGQSNEGNDKKDGLLNDNDATEEQKDEEILKLAFDNDNEEEERLESQVEDKLKLNEKEQEQEQERRKRREPKLMAPKSLETTLFDRLLYLHGPRIKRTLRVQYRMNELIMKFPSKSLYENKLIAHESVAKQKLSEILDLESGLLWKSLPKELYQDTLEEIDQPVVFFDTAGSDMFESTEAPENGAMLNSESKFNENEANIVVKHVKTLVDAGLDPSKISIICPYNAQVSLLRRNLLEKYPRLEIESVDGFQGREKEVIILSLVRSNEKHEVGFLSERRRLNVAMTRAKRLLTVVGDSVTVSQGGKFLKDWMEWLEENADVRILQAEE